MICLESISPSHLVISYNLIRSQHEDLLDSPWAFVGLVCILLFYGKIQPNDQTKDTCKTPNGERGGRQLTIEGGSWNQLKLWKGQAKHHFTMFAFIPLSSPFCHYSLSLFALFPIVFFLRISLFLFSCSPL